MTAAIETSSRRSIAALRSAARLGELPSPVELHGRFRQLQETCSRLGVPLSAVVIRLDDLEQLEQELGSDAQVAALARAAEAVMAQLRTEDEFGRWSHDELAVLYPGADGDVAASMAETISAAVEQAQVSHELASGVEITLPLHPSIRVVREVPAAAEPAPERLRVA